jgi:hypothetical protein
VNRVLRRIFISKMEELVGGWRRLQEEELHNLHASPNIIRVTNSEVDGAYSMLGRDEKCIQYFGWKAQRKETIGRPKHRWEENIRMDLREVGWEGVDWFHLAQVRDQGQALLNMVMNLWVP